MADLNVKIPALEKLADYAASGIGAVVRQEVKARLIEAKSDTDSLMLIAEA